VNLRRQLLLVSLLTLILPWAGCQFVRETETALREGQQQMLSGTAQAIADSLSQFPYELLTDDSVDGQVYAHALASAPLLDGYPDDWGLPEGALVSIRGTDGPVRYLFGQHRQHWYVYAEVRDVSPVYARAGRGNFDRVDVISIADDDQTTTYRFAAEAPGNIVARRLAADVDVAETRVVAHWQDLADGYSIEARIPRNLAGPRLGLAVFNTADALQAGITSRSFGGSMPGRAVTISPVLQSVAAGYVQPGWRLIITDSHGWRVATVGSVTSAESSDNKLPAGWMRMVYRLVLEPGTESSLADPAPTGRETQSYISEALGGETTSRWFRTADTDRAVISVAQPIWSGNVQTGALILQHGTDAILSQTNEALTRLIVMTLTATIVVAIVLLGYASWLSVRIRRLSEAAEHALDDKRLGGALPSALAADEVGDLSRSFSSVLRQLGVYNDYLRSLAGKLSHELRTPLTIVRSSLDNLEHESLPDEALEYTARAREGAERLQKILSAMSEATRTEQLIEHAEPEDFAPATVIASAVGAYSDAWPERRFEFTDSSDNAMLHGAPELIVQMLDKLVDNAIEFTGPGDTIDVALARQPDKIVISVTNPGPPLPDDMRGELFDSMVSVRTGEADKHLGLGLYVARIIAEGHDGKIDANNVEGGVRFTVTLPQRSTNNS
jgi:dedicated sortase system histidine kinase